MVAGGGRRLGKVALDAALLDHPVGANHPAAAPRGEAAPPQHRDHQPEQPRDHEDDPDRVEVEPGGAEVHREGEDRPITNRKMLKPIPTLCLPSTLRRSGQSRPFGRLLRPRQEETAASRRTLHIATHRRAGLVPLRARTPPAGRADLARWNTRRGRRRGHRSSGDRIGAPGRPRRGALPPSHGFNVAPTRPTHPRGSRRPRSSIWESRPPAWRGR
jgi:hypothetical protein